MAKDLIFGDGEVFDREYESTHQFEIVQDQGKIDWSLVNNDNILDAVAGMAAHVMKKYPDSHEGSLKEIGKYDAKSIGGGIL